MKGASLALLNSAHTNTIPVIDCSREKSIGVLPRLLRAVHGAVGVLGQALDISAVGRIDTDADTCADLALRSREGKRFLSGGEDSLRHGLELGRVRELVDQHDKLVATEARGGVRPGVPSDGVRSAQAFSKTQSERHQEVVTGVVSEAVIDLLEAVEGDE